MSGLSFVKRLPLQDRSSGPFPFSKVATIGILSRTDQIMGLEQLSTLLDLEVFLADSWFAWMLPLTWRKVKTKDSLEKLDIPSICPGGKH